MMSEVKKSARWMPWH